MANILLIGDLCGHSKVGISASIPVLSYIGHSVYTLATAIVSNNFDYGDFAIIDTTTYMRDALAAWQRLGFRFDAIATGYIASGEQARLVADFCVQESALGTKIFVDPIMGDCGSFYNGMPSDAVNYMAQMLRVSDVVIPNYTEACALAGVEYSERGLTRREAQDLVAALCATGARGIAITSAKVDGSDCIIVKDRDSVESYIVPYTYIPVFFPGTGDLFASVLMATVLEGNELAHSAKRAADVVFRFVDKHKDKPDKRDGIPLETSLNLLDE